MKMLGQLLLIVPLVLLAACETITTTSDFDRKATFREYKTYAWAPPPPSTHKPAPVVDEAIHAAVEKGLDVRGYTKAPAGKKPDFYVVYHVTAGEKGEVQHYTDWGLADGSHSGPGHYTGWPGNPTTYKVLDREKVGALILDFVEVRRNQLVWRGVASAVISDKPEHNVPAATEAVHRLLLKFPPPAGT
jgi:hypothetical protein